MTSTLRRAALLPLVLALALPMAVDAQSTALPTGRITGRIIDASTGAGLSDVGVQIVGTTLGTMSGIDGRYTIANVPAGTVTMQARRIGFAPKTVTGIMLEASHSLEQTISLETATVKLQVQVVTASAERGTVSEALDQQRTAPGIVSAVTAEQIARSPDGDAAAAVQRVSGVTIQDGKNVSVRGLGERYTTTTLNGARLPSPDPEKRIVPFDLFPAGLLQTITTSKTFTPDLPGDFSGAQVDIQTREFPANREVTYSTSIGINTAATGTAIPTSPSVGMEWLALPGTERSLPSMIAGIANFSGLTQSQVNNSVSSFRNAWSARSASGTPNGSFSASVGGSDPVFGREVGYLLSGTYSYAQEVRENERRGIAEAIGTGGTTSPLNEYVGTTGRRTVLWGGLFNLSTLLGQRSRIALNNTFTKTADHEARTDAGSEYYYNLDVKRTQLRFVERSIRSSQLTGEHQLGEGHRLDWSLSASGVTRTEPDRADVAYGRDLGSTNDVPYRWLTTNGAARTFAELDESGYGANASYQWSFGSFGREHRIKVGAAVRTTDRDADNTSYSITAAGLPLESRMLAPEQIFDGRFSGDDDAFFVLTPVSTGGSYTARDRVGAGFGMFEYAPFDRVRVIAGARVENADLTVTTRFRNGTVVSAPKQDTDVLPSVVINVRASESQSVRLSASQTLSRPEYREISPSTQCGAIGDPCFFGNPALERSLIQNYDARWEWYPSSGEVLSVGLFAKRFKSPIERVEVPTSGASQYTFINALGADNLGVELEARKDLATVAAWLTPMTVFANATFMRSEIDPGNEGTSASTRKRPMVGQAPYVVNAGVTYATESRAASATVLYNVVGERISIVGTNELPDVYERPRHMLDLSLRFPVFGNVSGKLDAKNLFDSEIRLEQGSVVREAYRAGRVFTVGLTWRP